MTKKIAITGVSSFTGAELAREFSCSGYEVHGLCRAELSSYTGLKLQRLRSLKGVVLHGNLKSERGDHAVWIKEHRPNVWIHHHHAMENFRLQTYDLTQANKVSLDPLDAWVRALEESHAESVIHTGSYFEPGEGGQPIHSVCTPYAHSKKEVWLALENRLKNSSLRLGKVVIPNPFGALENPDRLIPTLLMRARSGEPFDLWTPSASADQIPAHALAEVYVQTLGQLREKHRVISRPSGRVIDNATWVREVCDSLLRKRLQVLPPEIRVHSGDHERPALSYQNPALERIQIDWSQVWDEYAQTLSSITDAENRP
jgi:UDP-glucose 4-epimerase